MSQQGLIIITLGMSATYNMPPSHCILPSQKMTNPAEELHIKQAPMEFICSSCKRKQVLEPDQLVTSDTPNKKPKVEAKQDPNDDDSLACLQIAPNDESDRVEPKRDPNDDDDSLACLQQIASTNESDKDMNDRDDQPLHDHDSAEDELRESIFFIFLFEKSSFCVEEWELGQNDFRRNGRLLFTRFSNPLL